MGIKVELGMALKKVRISKNLTQEDFGEVSSRTYISSVERGLKSITLEKLDEISRFMGVHPLTILKMSYEQSDKNTNLEILIKTETDTILKSALEA